MSSQNHECTRERKDDRNRQHSGSGDIEGFGYSPKTAGGYTPPKSPGTTSNVPLPKGGSGASGQPNASSGQSGNAQNGTGTKK